MIARIDFTKSFYDADSPIPGCGTNKNDIAGR